MFAFDNLNDLLKVLYRLLLILLIDNFVSTYQHQLDQKHSKC